MCNIFTRQLTTSLLLVSSLIFSPNALSLVLSELVGTWTMSYDMGQGPLTGTITISEADDGSAKIVVSSAAGGSSEARDIEIVGDTLSFSRDINAQSQSLGVSYTAQLVDGRLQGEFELSIGGGATTWTASK